MGKTVTIESLEKENAGLKEQLKIKSNELSQSKALIKNLNTEIEKLNKAANNLGTELKEAAKTEKPELSKSNFTYDGKKYGFAFPSLRMGDKVITASDVLASEDLQKELIEMGSGFIVKK